MLFQHPPKAVKLFSMKSIIGLCEKLAPKRLAAEWDNIGLIIGDASEKIKGIVVALDVTQKVIDLAEKSKANLIIVHHPPIFEPTKKIDTASAKGKLIKRLMKSGISVFVMHTNLDSAPKGLNHYVGGMIGLKKLKSVTSSGIKYRIGELPKAIGSKAFALSVRKKLSLCSVRHYGKPKKVKKIALCTGSGADLLSEAVKKGAQLLVTGDVRHHNGIEAIALDVPIIDAGHCGTERPMVPLVVAHLKKSLTKRPKQVSIIGFDVEESFHTL